MAHGSKALVVGLVMTMTGCPAMGDDGMADDETTAVGMTEGVETEGVETEGAATEGVATEGATTEGATTEGATTAGGMTEGETTEDGTTGGDGAVVEACGLPMPCSQYLFACNPINGADSCASTPYPEGLVCMLETLAAGEQAQLYVNFDGIVTGEVEWIDIAVYGADQALYQYAFEDQELGVLWDPPQQCAPRPAEWFQACLADEGDGAQHIACMNPYEWFEGCSDAAACL